MSAEALVNTNSMIHGILDDWNYASRSLYTDPYPDLKALVNETKRFRLVLPLGKSGSSICKRFDQLWLQWYQFVFF